MELMQLYATLCNMKLYATYATLHDFMKLYTTLRNMQLYATMKLMQLYTTLCNMQLYATMQLMQLCNYATSIYDLCNYMQLMNVLPISS